MPGRFAEGPRHPGFILPASAVSEQENRDGLLQTAKLLRETDYFSSSPRKNS
jgi:hypothetical protein